MLIHASINIRWYLEHERITLAEGSKLYVASMGQSFMSYHKG
jgi:hypothetical protein